MGLTGRTPRRVLSAVLATCVIGAVPGAASAAVTDQGRAVAAATYIAGRQLDNGSVPGFSAIGTTADAVLAWVATGVGETPIARAIGYLRRQVKKGNVNTLGLRAKVSLAVEATGRNAQTFGGHNLISAIAESQRVGGRYGKASVLDQALGILAIFAATGTADTLAMTWLEAAQCPDGGWQYDRPKAANEGPHCRDTTDPTDSFASDTNTTAYAVMALSLPGGSWTHDPFAYFATMRDATHGGWGYTWNYRTTDANSTALVIQAYAADGQAPPAGSLKTLRKMQELPCGAFSYSYDANGLTGPDVGATVGAIPGLLLAPLPISGTVAGELGPPPVCGLRQP